MTRTRFSPVRVLKFAFIVAAALALTAPGSFGPAAASATPHGSFVRPVNATERSKRESAPTPQAQADWPEFRRDPAHSGYDAYETVLSPTTVGGLGVLWNYNTGTTVWSSPAVANGGLYYGADDGNVYALDTSTGALLWKYAATAQIWSSPAVVDGVVFVGAGTTYGPGDYNLYALDAATGSLLWKYTTGGNVQSSPVVANGVVYVTSGDDNVYALNATTGAVVWTYPGVSGTWSSPAVDNGVVYVGSGSGVYALNASNGALVWSFPMSKGTNSSPAIANGVVYVGSGAGDNKLYALDAATGAQNWEYTTGNGVDSSPAVANGVVYVGSYDGNAYALNSSSGALLWKYSTPYGAVFPSPAVANGVVYISSDSNIYALNAGTGGLLWSYQDAQKYISSPAVASGVVYIASSSGTVYAFGLGGAATSTSLASSLNPSSYGQSVTFNATVTSSSGTPTGTVIFYDGSTQIGSGALSSGVASFWTSSLPTGSDSITAAYQGSSSFAASTSAVLTQVVNGTATSTSLTSSLNPSNYGQSVTFTAAVSAASGTPTGTVLFYDGSTQIGSGTLSSGVASLSTSSLPVGSDPITAAYQGSSGFAPSTSAVLTQVVNSGKQTTTTSLVASNNPVRPREFVWYTATVTNQSGTPVTGTVTFSDGTVKTLSGNQAVHRTFYSFGTYYVNATYSGDANNLGSTSPTLVENVLYPSFTRVTTSGSPSVAGQPVTFTATVEGGVYSSGSPSGTVTFHDGGKFLGTVTLANQTATYTTSSLSGGRHTIRATYSGNATFVPSVWSVKQIVTKISTSATLTSSLNPAVYGQSITYTATVTSTGSNTPTGNVRFTNIGIVPLIAGVATVTKPKVVAGTHDITAEYLGDDVFASCKSPVLKEVVNPASTTLALTSSANPSTSGQTVTFTATVTSSTGATPFGWVTFTAGTTELGAVQLSGTTASISTSALPVGSTTIMASYPTRDNFTGSTASISQVVGQ